MMSDRKQYTAEFKRDAVRLMTQGGQSSTEVSRTLGVNVSLLGKWKRQLALAEKVQATGRNGYEAFPGQGRVHDEELARLRKENAALRMERDVLKKSNCDLCGASSQMKFAFIHTQLATPQAVQSRWSAVALCRIFEVSRSGYAAWKRRRKQPPSAQQQAKQQAEACLRLQIRAAHRRGRGYYGSPRVQDELCDQGIWVNLKRVARLMQEEGLRGRSPARRRVSTTDSRHSYRVADNLLERRFSPQEVARPNRFWCGDITYLPTATGWVYLAMVKDLFSRRIVGWAVDDSLEATLVATAWHRAMETRGFGAGEGPELYHSDRGSQYCSELFQDLLETSGTQPSMSAKGECLDNAVAESFFGTLKAELLADQPGCRFAGKTQAVLLVGDYIDNFYNAIRKHSALGNKCPLAFELEYQINTQ